MHLSVQDRGRAHRESPSARVPTRPPGRATAIHGGRFALPFLIFLASTDRSPSATSGPGPCSRRAGERWQGFGIAVEWLRALSAPGGPSWSCLCLVYKPNFAPEPHSSVQAPRSAVHFSIQALARQPVHPPSPRAFRVPALYLASLPTCATIRALRLEPAKDRRSPLIEIAVSPSSLTLSLGSCFGQGVFSLVGHASFTQTPLGDLRNHPCFGGMC